MERPQRPDPAGTWGPAKLYRLTLSGNELSGQIPSELASLTGLGVLDLNDNQLEGSLPPGLFSLSRLYDLNLSGNRLSGSLPAEFGRLARLVQLDLGDNNFSGPLPKELADLAELYRLFLYDNPDLSGRLPENLASSRIAQLLAGGTSLCVPDEPAFRDWLASMEHRIRVCSWADTEAYLTQVAQSREYPVPLVAGESVLLRVFVTSEQETDETMPPVRARFFVNGAEVHVAEISAGSGAIPTEIREGEIVLSANADVPGHVIRPGLEMVVEIDPAGTLDPGLGVSKRFPAEGRKEVDVQGVPTLRLTLVPFIWTGDDDRATATLVEELHPDHELFWETNRLLPVGAFEIKKHEPVLVDSNDPFDLLPETKRIRAMEGGDGHWMGLLLHASSGFSVAYQSGKASFVQPHHGSTIAHELGHNFSLGHAPCGVSPADPTFPHADGSIGVWGYDPRDGGSPVPPHSPDLMSYCAPRWISDYRFTNSLRFRLIDEGGGSAAPAAGRALLVSGRIDADSTLHLDPAFVIDAAPDVPDSGGPYALTGRRADGSALFSIAFDMQEVADGDRHSAFMFALPVRTDWASGLAKLVLSGPGGAVETRHGSEQPMAIVRDPRTGRVRAILGDPRGPAADSFARRDLEALALEPGLEVLVSRGLPAPDAWQR